MVRKIQQHYIVALVMSIVFVCLQTTILCSSSYATTNSIIVCVPMDNFPFAYYKENGEKAGYSLELLDALNLPYTIELTTPDFATSMAGLTSGHCSLVLAPILTSTTKRSTHYTLSQPIMPANLHALVLHDSPINDISDLQYSIIGVLKNNSAEKFAFKEYKGSTIFALNREKELVNLLLLGEIEVIIGTKPFLDYLSSNHEQLRILDKHLYSQKYAYALTLQQEFLQQTFNKNLQQLQDNGTLEKLYAKWFTTKAPENNPLDTHTGE